MGIFDFSFGLSQGGGTNVGASKDLMQFQSSQWRGNTKWYNLNGYKYLRQGLIDADYNPILAIGSSPLNGAMPNAAATDGTTSISGSASPSANVQASTAKKISESQIMVNKATANKLAEEALTQDNIRNNLDSQSALNLLQSEEIQRLLPYKERKLIADIIVADSLSEMNKTSTAYIPYNAESTRIQANAAKTNSEVNSEWTPVKIVGGALAGIAGVGGLGLLSRGKNIWKAYKTANQIKKYKKLNNSVSYYKDFAGTTIH